MCFSFVCICRVSISYRFVIFSDCTLTDWAITGRTWTVQELMAGTKCQDRVICPKSVQFTRWDVLTLQPRPRRFLYSRSLLPPQVGRLRPALECYGRRCSWCTLSRYDRLMLISVTCRNVLSLLKFVFNLRPCEFHLRD